MRKQISYIFLTVLFIQSSFAMKIEYEYNDCDGEHHSGAIITLEQKDIDPTIPSMQSNYNRLGAAILKGANENEIRGIHIKNITERNIIFARALIRKTYEIATDREVPLRLYLYGVRDEKHEILTEEWEPLQKNIDRFYINPYENLFITGSNYDSD